MQADRAFMCSLPFIIILRRGKIYAKNLNFCIAAVFVVCQRDNHIAKYTNFPDFLGKGLT